MDGQRASNYDFRSRLLAYIGYSDETQAGFARRSGVNVRSIWAYARGDEVPTLGNLRKIVAASGINADWWLGFTDTARKLERER